MTYKIRYIDIRRYMYLVCVCMGPRRVFLLLFSPYGNFFCPYTGPLCYFSSIGGPFYYVFLYIMTILGTFLPCGVFLLRFSLYNDYIGNIFYHVGAFLLRFSLYNVYIGNIFYHVGAFLLHFSSFGGLFFVLILYSASLLLFLHVRGFLLHFSLYWEHFLPCGGGGPISVSAVVFPYGGPFLGSPPPMKTSTYLFATPHHIIMPAITV